MLADTKRELSSALGQLDDDDSADLVGTVIADFEKHAWFLRATLA